MSQIVVLQPTFQFLQSSIADFDCDCSNGIVGQGLTATVSMQKTQCQILTSHLLILVLPQKEQVYLACC